MDADHENAVHSLVLSAETADADRVLKVNYKLATYTVIYHANVYGTFAGNQTYTALWKKVSSPCEIPDEEEKPTSKDEEKKLCGHEVNIILHVMIGVILGFILGVVCRSIRQKIRKRHLVQGLDAGSDE